MNTFEKVRKEIQAMKARDEFNKVKHGEGVVWVQKEIKRTELFTQFFDEVIDSINNLERINYITATSYEAAKLLYEHSMYISEEEIEEVKDMKIPKEHFKLGTWEEERKKYGLDD